VRESTFALKAPPGSTRSPPGQQGFHLPLQGQDPLLSQRDAVPELVAARAAIFRVHIDRDRLQVLDEQRLEVDQRVELPARDVEEALDRLLPFVLRRDIAVDVIDDLRVESSLRLERRTEQPPHEAAESSFDRTIRRRRAIGQDVPGHIERRHPVVVVSSRRRRKLGRLLDRVVDSRQRVIVQAVGFEALTLQPDDQIVKRLFGHIHACAQATRHASRSLRFDFAFWIDYLCVGTVVKNKNKNV